MSTYRNLAPAALAMGLACASARPAPDAAPTVPDAPPTPPPRQSTFNAKVWVGWQETAIDCESSARAMRQSSPQHAWEALRASPIPFLTRIGLPGKSYHAGGAFPMRRDPGARESDLLGRPMGLTRVHLIDSSVFPTIPATNITLTLMANAHRIAAASAALDARSATSAAQLRS